MNKPIKKIVIVGGGTAGWMTGAALSKLMGKSFDISLIESDQIGTVGVGEATIPTLLYFHKLLGINEAEFMAETSATFKLGINFENWRDKQHEYFHSFGMTGQSCWAAGFQHFWLKGRENGIDFPFGDYCLELKAGLEHKFSHLPNNGLNYAFHLDASKYALFLRKLATTHGLKRIEGKIEKVSTSPQDGHITSVQLASGKIIEGDLFIDCSGFQGLLIEKTLRTGYDDWSHWLPANSALAVQTESSRPAVPFTRSIAHSAGWQWQIPLQHRMGNGHVYCDGFMDDLEAADILLNNLPAQPLMEPRKIKFTTGRRRKLWNKNCIAVGLSSGFIEPLESTSIHLIQQSVIKMMRLLPQGLSDVSTRQYNQEMDFEIERIRDFIILHYKVTDRQDSEFWRYCRQMDIPDTLKHKIELFKETGVVIRENHELFAEDSWMQVMMGQGIMPSSYHPIADMMSPTELEGFLRHLRTNVQNNLQQLVTHSQYVNHYARAKEADIKMSEETMQ